MSIETNENQSSDGFAHKNMLKMPVFQNIAAYSQEQLNLRYSQILEKFMKDVLKILTTEQKNLLVSSYTTHGNTTVEQALQLIAESLKLDVSVKLDLYYNTYNSTRVEENSFNRCLARTSTGKQCTRAHNNTETKLCGNHMRQNPYGLIGESDPVAEQKKIKRQQKCYKTVKSLKGIDLNDFIKTTEIELGDSSYLLDEHGVLYDPLNLNIVGQIQGDTVCWFRSTT
jgi:hypothetical protein